MCVTEGNLTRICAEHAAETIAAFTTKYPDAFDLAATSDCQCCGKDRVADKYGWDVAWEFDGIKWLKDAL